MMSLANQIHAMQWYIHWTNNSINQLIDNYSSQKGATTQGELEESPIVLPQKASQPKAARHKVFIVTKQKEEGEIRKARRFFCCTYKQCTKCYRSRENLMFHIQNIHFNQKPYKCKYCSNAFSHRNGLNYHMKHAHADVLISLKANTNSG